MDKNNICFDEMKSKPTKGKSLVIVHRATQTWTLPGIEISDCAEQTNITKQWEWATPTQTKQYF